MKVTKQNDTWKVDLPFKKIKDRLSVLLLSDLHIDSPKADLRWLKGIMNDAVASGSGIVIIGDLYDIMGMKYDKRSLKSDIRKDLQEDDYIMRVAKLGADFLAPYADNILLVSRGNHETSLDRRIEMTLFEITNLILFKEHGKQINFTEQYEGFIRFQGLYGTSRFGKTLYFHHGSGGNATMSFGTLNIKRQAAIIEADIYASGHLHTAWSKPLVRMRLTNNGTIEMVETIHLQLGTSKDSGKWERENRFDHPNKTFYYLDFWVDKYEENKEKFISLNVIERRVK